MHWQSGAAVVQIAKLREPIAQMGSLLADIYDWITKGFDTADLKDAKALLQELA